VKLPYGARSGVDLEARRWLSMDRLGLGGVAAVGSPIAGRGLSFAREDWPAAQSEIATAATIREPGSSNRLSYASAQKPQRHESGKSSNTAP
jgi:hypothetical protein